MVAYTSASIPIYVCTTGAPPPTSDARSSGGGPCVTHRTHTHALRPSVSLGRPATAHTPTTVTRITMKAMLLALLAVVMMAAYAEAGGYLAAGGVYNFDPDKDLDYMTQAREAGEIITRIAT